MTLRRLPPVYSPLPVAAIRSAAIDRSDPFPPLRALLRERLRCDAVLLCDSGTTALRLALGMTSTASSATPVALPAFGCFDIVSAAVGANVHPLFYDLDPHTLGPDFTSLERVLEAGARTIVVAHLYGTPIDWDRLSGLAERYDARIVEDAAMGHGGEWRGAPLGSLGSVAVLSFGRGKGWTGVGGGALVARGEAAAGVEALPPLPDGGGVLATGRVLGLALGQAVFGSPALYGIPSAIPGLRLGETVYRPPGPMTQMSRVSARLALATVAVADSEVSARRGRSARYRDSIPAESGARYVDGSRDGAAGALRAPVLVSGGLPRLGTPGQIRALGIESSYPQVLPTLKVLAPLGFTDPSGWPGARRLVDELVTLPTHSLVEEEDVARILDVMPRQA